MKDEWGFPPCFDGCPEKNDFWYSEAMRKAFGDKTGGRDLVNDFWEEGRSASQMDQWRAMLAKAIIAYSAPAPR